jgi:hypothetical protein
MSSEPEHDEPNDEGFAGDPATPTPEPGTAEGTGEGFGEAIAVPAGDITGSLMAAINEAGGHHDDEPEKN